MFVFSIQTMENSLAKLASDIYQYSSPGYKKALEQFADMPNVSIDYAVAEKSKNIVVIPMEKVK